MEAHRGREEVFETPDLPPEFEDHSHSSAPLEPQDLESVVPTPLDADAAFEVFHGRRFETRGLPDLSGSIAHTGVGKKAATAAAAASSSSVVVEETPVQRYLRLKAEAVELEEEVAALASAPDGQDEEGGERNGGSAMLWKQLAGEVEGLRAQLLGLEGAVGGEEDGEEGITSIASAAAEVDLAEALLRRVGALGLGDEEGNGKRRSSKQQGAAGEGGDEVVYELYYQPGKDSGSSASSRAAALQAVERRLAALEQAVLAVDNGGEGGAFGEGEEGLVLAARTLPLAEAVAKVERQAALLDPTSVETLRQRLALLRGEWEDFRRERGSKHTAGDGDAHAQRVEALWEQARRLAPLAGDLPALVGRLQALQGLHAESLAFSQRLHRLESGQDALAKLLEGAAASLAGVKASLQENVAAMAENVREVDARLAELK